MGPRRGTENLNAQAYRPQGQRIGFKIKSIPASGDPQCPAPSSSDRHVSFFAVRRPRRSEHGYSVKSRRSTELRIVTGKTKGSASHANDRANGIITQKHGFVSDVVNLTAWPMPSSTIHAYSYSSPRISIPTFWQDDSAIKDAALRYESNNDGRALKYKRSRDAVITDSPPRLINGRVSFNKVAGIAPRMMPRALFMTPRNCRSNTTPMTEDHSTKSGKWSRVCQGCQRKTAQKAKKRRQVQGHIERPAISAAISRLLRSSGSRESAPD